MLIMMQTAHGQTKADLRAVEANMQFESVTAEPEELQKLCDAFDAAWIAINTPHPVHSSLQSAARDQLAYLITQLWVANPRSDLAELAAEQCRNRPIGG